MKAKSITKIFYTKDYEIFNTLAGNREVNIAHIKKLERSFEQEYLISPILINEKFEIIDGQHRFEAARNLGLPVYYYMITGYKLSQVQRLNTNLKEWKKADYLESYASLGYKEYILFKKFMTEFPMFSITSCQVILSNTGTTKLIQSNLFKSDTNKSGRISAGEFKNGNFKVHNYKLAVQNAKKILDFKPYYDGYGRQAFVSAMVRIFHHENYDHERMIARLKSYPAEFGHCLNMIKYREQIETVFNYRSRKKLSLIY
jgi:hypothetical protein